MAFSFRKKAKGGISASKLDNKAAPMTVKEEAIDIAKTVLLAVVITVIFRIFFFQPFNIPSGSMQPNLLVGDFIGVSKGTYGYSRSSLIFPLTRMNVRGHILGHDPEQGDVVVFKNQYHGNRDYIKRLIGLPGDEVQMIGGTLYLNGQQVPREFVSNETIECGAYKPAATTYRETLPNGVTYIIQECSGDQYTYDNVGPFKVPEGHYFFMGDNRDNSMDSRTHMVKMVPRDAVVGKARRLVFSVDGDKARLWQFWKWPVAIRYSRIFDQIK
ncbi:MAG: signal peptidase I [Parvularculaceae bacterium]